MKKPAMTVMLLTAIGVGVICAQTGGGTPFRIEKLDPALDEVVAPDAMRETLGDRFALTEGPVWVGEGTNGYLLFSDIAANVIYKWSPNAPLSVYLEKSGFTGTDNTRAGAQTVAGRVAILPIGSNGHGSSSPDSWSRRWLTGRCIYAY